MTLVARLFALSLLGCVTASAQQPPAWTEPYPPHRIAGNLHYVGSKGLACFLVTTPEGHILINSGLEESVPLIRDSIEQLGFRFADVKILLISHAHSDHCAGSAELIRQTGANYFVMEEDADTVENGGPPGPRILVSYLRFPPAKVDRRLRDGDEVTLGGTTLVARLTPGHTPGCTTWTMRIEDSGRQLDAVIVGSPNVNPGYVLVNNRGYPGIATDYARCFQVLKSLPVDFFLGAHGDYYGMEAKHARLGSSDANPFIDPEGYRAYVTDRENAFLAERTKQRASAAVE